VRWAGREIIRDEPAPNPTEKKEPTCTAERSKKIQRGLFRKEKTFQVLEHLERDKGGGSTNMGKEKKGEKKTDDGKRRDRRKNQYRGGKRGLGWPWNEVPILPRKNEGESLTVCAPEPPSFDISEEVLPKKIRGCSRSVKNHTQRILRGGRKRGKKTKIDREWGVQGGGETRGGG